jgi:hypothetical protein
MKNESGRQNKKKSALDERIVQIIRELIDEAVRRELAKRPKSFLDELRTK